MLKRDADALSPVWDGHVELHAFPIQSGHAGLHRLRELAIDLGIHEV